MNIIPSLETQHSDHSLQQMDINPQLLDMSLRTRGKIPEPMSLNDPVDMSSDMHEPIPEAIDAFNESFGADGDTAPVVAQTLNPNFIPEVQSPEEQPEDKRGWWTKALQDFWIVPGSEAERTIRENALAEQQQDNDRVRSLAEQRRRRLIADEINKLHVRAEKGTMTEEAYNAALDRWEGAYQEAFGVPITRSTALTTDANRAKFEKALQPLYDRVQTINELFDPRIEAQAKKMMAFNIMKKLSGDVGSVSDKERVHFLHAMLSDEDKAAIGGTMQEFLNGAKSALKRAGIPSLEASTNTILKLYEQAQKSGDPEQLKQVATMGAALGEAIKMQTPTGPDTAVYLEGLKQAWDLYLYGQIMQRSPDFKMLDGLVNSQLAGDIRKAKSAGIQYRVDPRTHINQVEPGLWDRMLERVEGSTDVFGDKLDTNALPDSSQSFHPPTITVPTVREVPYPDATAVKQPPKPPANLNDYDISIDENGNFKYVPKRKK